MYPETEPYDQHPRPDAPELAGIPGVLIHGRLDISGPADVAWRTAQAWPDAELRLVEEEGHGAGGAVMRDLIIRSLDRLTESTKI